MLSLYMFELHVHGIIVALPKRNDEIKQAAEMARW